MLYRDWDIVLSGTMIRITPLEERDNEAYGRLLYGTNYDHYIERLKDEFDTGLRKTLNHIAIDEMHAIRPLNEDRFIGWITLQKDPEGRPDIGISLIQECQNKGFGPEAVTLFANRLYQEY